MSVAGGWAAIVLALLALIPSFCPGAMSLIGLAMSFLALLLSLFSIAVNGKKYFNLTALLVLTGVLLVNDALRVWESSPMPPVFRLSAYAALLLVITLCFVAANQFERSGRSASDKATLR